MPTRRSRTIRRCGVALGLALLTVPLLSSCSAGFSAETTRERTVLDGTNATVGDLKVRYVNLDDGQVSGYVYNNGSSQDSLTSVKVGDGDLIRVNTDLPVGQLTGLGEDSPGIDLHGQELPVGLSASVTLTFAGAGSITMTVPVQLPNVRPTRSPVPTE